MKRKFIEFLKLNRLVKNNNEKDDSHIRKEDFDVERLLIENDNSFVRILIFLIILILIKKYYKLFCEGKGLKNK